MIAIERAGLALAALARNENRRYDHYHLDQQVVGQYAEACVGLRGEKS